MALHLHYSQRALRFNFPARTSRGALTEHLAWYLHLSDDAQPGRTGLGEAAPLAGLSPDYGPGFEARLQQLCQEFNAQSFGAAPEAVVEKLVEPEWAALRFGLETALLDWQQGGQRQLFDTPFSRGEAGISINGLVWMGDAEFMRAQIRKKLTEGYTCLKLKIGGIDFATELELLRLIRREASPAELTLRVDANGAFRPVEALSKLQQLAEFSLHSIEQPIQPGQWPALASLCRSSPVPIALDEELINLTDKIRQTELLETVRPAYLVLKPTLLGGLAATSHWIALARQQELGWWLTSALESNVGLNAISQYTAQQPTQGMPQGLGTGQLYHNNVPAPLRIEAGQLWYDPENQWVLPE
ncbi:o-succinylbenzoate synthase [Hymenobacter lutimineralis]|uniref:O-succinylbenzoate synthase n=1 Tax=Hymenobacter lutimineralis TaxID=2606448 RepID=A0A5D6VGI0_9BACT|nr:o-succinylbenzoate synthase [Hymenobacter lutimineralis]TYZ14222.1 o-succinylbenzoate synthase [Hymenobacter lutimineralis]